MSKRSAFQILIDFLATGLYSGKIPFAPGTCGTFAAMLIASMILDFIPVFTTLWAGLGLAAFLTIVALYVTDRALKMKIYGAERKDPSQIVIDEYAGYFFAIVGLGSDATTLLLAFFLFRIFDVLKPPPIRRIESLPGAWGVVIDDVVAGIFANLAARLILIYFLS